jgi:hypothetical protein
MVLSCISVVQLSDYEFPGVWIVETTRKCFSSYFFLKPASWIKNPFYFDYNVDRLYSLVDILFDFYLLAEICSGSAMEWLIMNLNRIMKAI